MSIDPALHKLLIVDDEDTLREFLHRIIRGEGFQCYKAASGEEALDLLMNNDFSLMILDINMPGMSGIELLQACQQRFKDLAVLMLTGVDDRKTAIKTLELGAYGYVVKPFARNEIIINTINVLQRRELEIANRIHSEELHELVLEKTKGLRKAEQETRQSREETILRLARAAEFRDNQTVQHTIRMSHYCRILATKTGLPADKCEQIRLASQLHDVGKIGVPDSILLKPGRLTAEEFESIKKHSEIGYRILSESQSDLLEMGAVIALTHHEKYNGAGYPHGTAGEDIPLVGRIAAICDVFDALTSDRVYMAAVSVENTVETLIKNKGAHFDPMLLDLFLESMDEILSIKNEFSDG